MKKLLIFGYQVKFCLGVIFTALLVSSCGGNPLFTQKTDKIEIVLKIPAETDANLFWSGVSKRDFYWREHGSGDLQHFSESTPPGAAVLSPGGDLSFEGKDSSERLLVSGSTSVSENSKQIIINLQRVF